MTLRSALLVWLSLAGCVSSAQAQVPQTPEERCVSYLGKAEGAFLLPTFGSAVLKSQTCRCAIDEMKARRSDPSASDLTTEAAALMHSCFSKALLELYRTGPRELLSAPTALAEAIEPRERPKGYLQASLKSASTCQFPEYPTQAARANATGTTVMAYRIGPFGAVQDAQILKSAGTTDAHKLLDATVLIAMMRCEFTPASVDGSPIEAWTTVTFHWRLE